MESRSSPQTNPDADLVARVKELEQEVSDLQRQLHEMENTLTQVNLELDAVTRERNAYRRTYQGFKTFIASIPYQKVKTICVLAYNASRLVQPDEVELQDTHHDLPVCVVGTLGATVVNLDGAFPGSSIHYIAGTGNYTNVTYPLDQLSNSVVGHNLSGIMGQLPELTQHAVASGQEVYLTDGAQAKIELDCRAHGSGPNRIRIHYGCHKQGYVSSLQWDNWSGGRVLKLNRESDGTFTESICPQDNDAIWYGMTQEWRMDSWPPHTGWTDPPDIA